jgi:hypothetical protein
VVWRGVAVGEGMGKGMGASEGVDSCVEGGNLGRPRGNGGSFERLFARLGEKRVCGRLLI